MVVIRVHYVDYKLFLWALTAGSRALILLLPTKSHETRLIMTIIEFIVRIVISKWVILYFLQE